VIAIVSLGSAQEYSPSKTIEKSLTMVTLKGNMLRTAGNLLPADGIVLAVISPH
jgi:hypothetical protein